MTFQQHQNIWDALESDPVQAANLKLRSQLMVAIADYVEQSGLTQAQAAKKLGTTQPRLNDVLKSKIEKCTVDRLVNMLGTVGFKVDLRISQAA